MTTLTSTLIVIVTAWAVLFLISLPVLAALVRSSQLSRAEEQTSLAASSGDDTYPLGEKANWTRSPIVGGK
jgi:hypothetical protein